MTSIDYERARSADAKREREVAILDSATKLATEHGVRDVTLTDIAAGVGMHKSTMLRYFETREDIFLHLSSAGWAEWSEAVRGRIVELGPPPGAAQLEARIAAISGILASTLTARRLFCDLLAHTPLNLERGVSFEAVRSFKVGTLAAARSVAAVLRDALPLDQTAADNIVATSTALAGALWQMAAPGTELRQIYESTPELAHAVVDVGPRLSDVLTALLRGYLATP
jgi:AcrR family transcriptional regulator